MDNTTDYSAYHQYLLRNSLFGNIYRKFFLYPVLRFIAGPSFLDVGCGIGDFLRFGKRSCSLGLDVNPLNVAYACRRGLAARVVPDSGQFPVSSSEYRSCILDQVIEHLEDPTFLISEVHRCLSENGIFIVGVPCEKGFRSDSDHKIFYQISNLVPVVVTSSNFRFLYSFYFPFPGSIFGKFFRIQFLYCVFKKVVVSCNEVL